MNCFRKILCCAFCILLFASGCTTKQPTATPIAPTPAPVTAADLLADALQYYEAGDYEEAIIAYLGVIEIEPRNFDAQLGLGKAYRSAGKNEEAIATLLTAREMDAESIETAYELGYAYIGVGQYEAAQSLAEPLWQEGDADAGVVLLMSLAAQGKIEEVRRLMQEDETLTVALKAYTGEDSLYMGGVDENGQRSGKGVGLYPSGYVYVGDYADGVRSGQGTWYYPGGRGYFIGIWADDMPNGNGSFESFPSVPAVREEGIIYGIHITESGSLVDGLFHGTIHEVWDMEDGHTHVWNFSVNHGNDGVEKGQDIALCSNCGANLVSSGSLWGIIPWKTTE